MTEKDKKSAFFTYSGRAKAGKICLMCKLTSASNAQPATSNICPRTGKCCSNCRTSARIEAQANGTSIALVLEQQTQKSAPEPTK